MDSEESQGSKTEMSEGASSEESDELMFKPPPLPLSPSAGKTTFESGEKPDDIAVVSVAAPSFDYRPPPWACEPLATDDYAFEVIKNGSLIGTYKLVKRRHPTFIIIGRFELCDIRLEHPTISRYHCVLQYGEDIMDRTGKGWHVYDLGSTHGTKLNKQRVPPKQFIRIRVGHVMQFGGSSRIMTLIGPASDVEAEWEYSPTEMKQKREQRKLDEKLKKTAEKENTVEKEENDDAESSGSDYGEEMVYAKMREDFDAEENEAKYMKDPLKTLSHFFEQEGFDMEFSFTELGSAHTHKWTCSIELPVETAAGQSLSATATVSGSKKEAQVACALNACRTLDMHGVLYRSSTARKKRERNLEENDFYDSDEDTFFDRTGQVEKSRENRKRRALEAQGKVTEEKDTYESLLKKAAAAEEQIKSIESRLQELSKKDDDDTKDAGEDELDAFCRHLSHSETTGEDLTTKTEKSQLRLRLVEVKHEKERMEKLAKIVKPVALPELKIPSQTTQAQSGESRKSTAVSAATMNKLMNMRRAKAGTSSKEAPKETVSTPIDVDKPFVAEEEEDEEKNGESVNVATSVPSQSTVIGPRMEDKPSGSGVAESEEKLTAPAEIDAETDLVKETVDLSEKDEDELAATDVVEEAKVPSASETEIPTKRRRIRVRIERGTAKAQETSEYGEGSATRDEDYAMWVPPDEQSGDGKTALNAKFAGRY